MDSPLLACVRLPILAAPYDPVQWLIVAACIVFEQAL
jgi:hypothetical protein